MTKRDKSDKSITPDLPPAEMEVLAFVHHHGPVTIREVSEGLEREMGISAAKAQILRLEKKGLLERERIKGTRILRFASTAKAEPTYRFLSRRFVDRVFCGSPVNLVASFFDTREPTPEEIEQLKHIVAEAQKRKKQ